MRDHARRVTSSLRVAALSFALSGATATAQSPQLVRDIHAAPGAGSSVSVLGPSPITGDPVLGGVWSLSCTGLSQGEVGAVFASPPGSACVPVAPLRCVHLDPVNAFPVATVMGGPMGEWSGSLPLPNQPSAIGLDLVVQPLFVAPALPLGLDVGDALWLSLGL